MTSKIVKKYLKSLNEEMTPYQKYFKSKLEKWKVNSPEDLNDEQKKKFFDDVDSGWNGKKETD